MATNLEIFNSNLENLDLFDEINDLVDLKTELPSKFTETPYKDNWGIVFNYKNTGDLWEIVTRKESGIYSVRVKKRVKLPTWKFWWQTQKYNGNETFNFKADDLDKFNIELWNALDEKIGTNRKKIPGTGKVIFNMLNKWNEQQNWSRERAETPKKTKLEKKPIDLHYAEKNKEYVVNWNKPDRNSVEWRVLRSLRWASATDAVEDRYGIPRGLLLAIAAQESFGDPAVPNLGWDGWAGLLHIQPKYAAQYWLKTLERHSNWAVDTQHGKSLNDLIKENGSDLKVLSEYDDRFNIVQTTDLSARFLINEYKRSHDIPKKNDWEWWLKVASRYNSPTKTKQNWPTSYWKKVLYYWTVINKVRWDYTPSWLQKSLQDIVNWKTSLNVNGDWNTNNIHTTTEDIKKTRDALKNMNATIDGKNVSEKKFYKYHEDQCENYWLKEYKHFNKEHPYVQ